MARSTLEAVFGALGAGLQGYGRDRNVRFEQEQARLDRERQMQRDRLADELSVAGLLERGFGGQQEVRQQGAQRANTALQMALQGATAGLGGVAPTMPTPTQVQQIAAQQARPQREVVNVAGRQLSLLETALEKAQRERAQRLEEAGVARAQQVADAEREFEQAKALEGIRGRNALAAARVRAASEQTPTTGQGERGVLPTVTGAIADLKTLRSEDIRNLRAGNVQTVQETPQLVAQARGPLEYAGARGIQFLGNVQATEAEQRYALQARAVSDAVARANERGVLSNQDNDRYIRQVSLISGDKPAIKELKVQNLISWAEWLSNANQMLASGATQEQVKASATAHANSLESANLRTWAASNPQGRSETDEQYIARFRREMGVR